MPSDRQALFLSVKPRFIEMLVAGTKTVELRRRPPVSVGGGGLVLLYASSPRMALVATARIEAIEVAKPDQIWLKHQGQVGVTHTEFHEYFEGAPAATAISLRDIKPRASGALALNEIRARWHGFMPPQSYRYVEASRLAAVL
ncbi:MAG: ASCH domain-containing protein [Patulibacter sp.]|nr:ASCH domain-containing protein [Patulibacter sp.]